MSERREHDRGARDWDRERERRAQEEEDERRELTERRGEELQKAWRNRHPEREKDRPKKPD
jgi:hypothetical protein